MLDLAGGRARLNDERRKRLLGVSTEVWTQKTERGGRESWSVGQESHLQARPERLLAKGAIRLQNKRYGLAKVLASLLQRCALRVCARKLLDKRDEALGYLLEDGGQLDGHGKILERYQAQRRA